MTATATQHQLEQQQQQQQQQAQQQQQLQSNFAENQSHSIAIDTVGKLDFKVNFVAGGSCGTGSNTNPLSTTTGQQSNSICSINSLSPTNSDGNATQQQHQHQHQFQHQQNNQQPFNIFPAIFSRQLNFSAAAAAAAAAQQTSKLMDDLRPNLVGGLLGLQQGLLDDHALAHGNLQHHHHYGSSGGGGGSGSSSSSHQEHSKSFMSTLQDSNRCLMGITTHESNHHRLLGLSSHDLRSAATINNLDNSSKNSTSIGHGGGGGGGGGGTHQSRKCSSTPEDFSALYGGLTASGLDTSTHHHHHHHTPAHTPPSSRLDHSITGNKSHKQNQNQMMKHLTKFSKIIFIFVIKSYAIQINFQQVAFFLFFQHFNNKCECECMCLCERGN